MREVGAKSVLVHGRLYVRNAEEMACYDLDQAAAP
jgi:hypothetical protein